LYVIKSVSVVLLILMGILDCLTTVVGTMYFGAQKLNPFIAILSNFNLAFFVAIKLVVTVCVGLVFVLPEKTLHSTEGTGQRSLKIA
jgi:hypothetical protein